MFSAKTVHTHTPLPRLTLVFAAGFKRSDCLLRLKTSLELRVAGFLVARTRSRLFICKAYSWTATSRSKHMFVFLAVYGLVYFFFARRSKIAAAASCCTFIVHNENILHISKAIEQHYFSIFLSSSLEQSTRVWYSTWSVYIKWVNSYSVQCSNAKIQNGDQRTAILDLTAFALI